MKVRSAVILTEKNNEIQPFEKVCGLSIIERAIKVFEREGVKDLLVISEDLKLKSHVMKIKTESIQLRVLSPKDSKAHPLAIAKGKLENPFFLVNGSTIFSPGILKELKESDSNNFQTVKIAFSEKLQSQNLKNNSLVTVAKGKVIRFGIDLNSTQTQHTGLYAGVALCNENIFNYLEQKIENKKYSNLSSAMNYLLEEKLLEAVSVQDNYWLKLGNKKDLKTAETMLLQSLKKPIDGIVSKNINRNVSLFITKRVCKTNLRPNHMSVITLLVGLASGIVVASGGYLQILIGAFLYQLASILDGCDGELARLKFMQSKLGEWVDTVADDICNHAFLIGLTINAASSGESFLAQAGWIGISFSLGCTFMYYAQLILHYKSGDLLKIKMFFENDNQPTKENESFLSNLKYCVKRDFFVFFFFCLAALGIGHSALGFFLLGSSITFFVVLTDFVYKVSNGYLTPKRTK